MSHQLLSTITCQGTRFDITGWAVERGAMCLTVSTSREQCSHGEVLVQLYHQSYPQSCNDHLLLKGYAQLNLFLVWNSLFVSWSLCCSSAKKHCATASYYCSFSWALQCIFAWKEDCTFCLFHWRCVRKGSLHGQEQLQQPIVLSIRLYGHVSILLR